MKNRIRFRWLAAAGASWDYSAAAHSPPTTVPAAALSVGLPGAAALVATVAHGPLPGTSTEPALGRFGPVGRAERLGVLDALRGLALLGILLVNIWSYSGYSWLSEEQKQALASYPADRVVHFALSVLIDTKFVTIFSILFGVGFHLQLERAAAQGKAFKGYFVRRMVLLGLIGCLHAYLFWMGDILRYYALIGLLLVLLSRWPAPRLLRLAVLFGVVLTAAAFILTAAFPLPIAGFPSADEVLSVFGRGSYREVLSMNWRIDDIHNFIESSPLTLVGLVGRITLGFWLGRIGLFEQPQKFRGLLKKWVWWGLAVGLPSSVALWALRNGHLELDWWLLWVPFVVTAGIILHSLFYIGVFLLLYPRLQRLLTPFAAVGRMALTNYVGQSLIGLFIFYGFMPGFHLFGQVGPALLLAMTLGIFGLQLMGSAWWLSRHSQGPVEWLWRKLAYAGM